MNRKQKGMAWAALGFTILWVSLVLAAPSSSQAKAPGQDKDVRVINGAGEPVPVTGTVNVGSLPAVTVASLPAVSLLPGSALQVGNTALNPVVVRDPESNRMPFLFTTSVSVQTSFQNAVGEAFTVPGGKRLVLEGVSFRAQFGSLAAGGRFEIQIFDQVGNGYVPVISVPLFKQGTQGTSDVYVGFINPNLRMIAGARADLDFYRFGDPSQTAFGIVTFSGYLVDAP